MQCISKDYNGWDNHTMNVSPVYSNRGNKDVKPCGQIFYIMLLEFSCLTSVLSCSCIYHGTF